MFDGILLFLVIVFSNPFILFSVISSELYIIMKYRVITKRFKNEMKLIDECLTMLLEDVL